MDEISMMEASQRGASDAQAYPGIPGAPGSVDATGGGGSRLSNENLPFNGLPAAGPMVGHKTLRQDSGTKSRQERMKEANDRRKASFNGSNGGQPNGIDNSAYDPPRRNPSGMVSPPPGDPPLGSTPANPSFRAQPPQ